MLQGTAHRNYTKLSMIILAIAAVPVLAAVGVDITFSEVYPPGFWGSTLGMVLIAIGFAVVAAAIAAITIGTAGTGGAILGAAGPWFTAIGSAVGTAAGVGSGAAAAGLAILGGGTIASGGFGMAGGIFVISALTGAATGVVTDVVFSQVNDELINKPYKRYEFIKVPLSESGSSDVVDLVETLSKLDEKLAEGEITTEEYSKQTKDTADSLSQLLANACDDVADNKESVFNAVNAAIYALNTGDSDKAKKCFAQLELRASNASFVSYLSALDSFADGNYQEGFRSLDLSIAREPSALQPYILYSMALSDNSKYAEVVKITSNGLDDVDDDNFHLLYARGEAYYQLQDYLKAADDFSEAYDEVSENIVEVDTAMMAAISYLKGGDPKKGRKWYDKAIKKVEGKDDLETEKLRVAISERWNCFVNTEDLSQRCLEVRGG